MPYISINTSLKLSVDQKEKIKAELGRLISIIPEKTEAGTIVDFSDDRTIYKAGEKREIAFIELRIFRECDFEYKKKFTEETFSMLSRELGLKIENMSLNILVFNNWGTGGTLRE